MKKLIGLFFVSLFCLVSSTTVYATWSLSSTRGITWEGNVGVKGDIPIRTSIYQMLGVVGQASTYSQSVTAAQIQTAVNSCPPGQVVYLNAGTYTLNATIQMRSNVTLRGAGMNSTILTGRGNTGHFIGSTAMIEFYSGYSDPGSLTTSNISSTYTAGANSITLANASAFPAKGFVFVDELNDTTIPVVGGSWGGGITWNDTRNWAVLHEITGKSGNTLFIDPPAVHTFTSGFAPRATRVQPTYIQYSGVEHLTIKSTDSNHIGVGWQGAANCWAYKVKVQKYGHHGMWMFLDTFRNTIRQCYITDAYNHADSDHYAIQTGVASSFNLIESNVFYNVTNGVVLQGSSGNVVAYNYFNNVHRTSELGSWFWADNWAHQSFVNTCLWEGNYAQAVFWDNVDRGNGFNTLFRNRLTGYDESGLQSNATENNGCVGTYSDTYYTNVIGNVLGRSGYSNAYENSSGSNKPIFRNSGYPSGAQWKTQYRHQNYNYYTKTIKDCNTAGEPGCQGESSDTTLPNSLYLSSKPSWFGNQIWPPVDPKSPALTDANRIPAKVFYDTGSWPEESNGGTAPAQVQGLKIERIQ